MCTAVIGEVLRRITKNNVAIISANLSSAERVKSFIDSNVKNNKTIRQLASISGTNECYLKKEFKALTGCSIADYRQKQRVRRAQDLLERGIFNIETLAAEVGYRNTDYFIKVFQRHIGVHPKEYQFARINNRRSH